MSKTRATTRATLSVRLTEEESHSLTAFRAVHELETLERASIRDIVEKIIEQGAKEIAAGTLVLPKDRQVKEIAAGAEFERVAFLKSESAQANLLQIKEVTGTDHSQVDIVRELLKLFHERDVQPRVARFFGPCTTSKR
jgi:hypothetical protein